MSAIPQIAATTHGSRAPTTSSATNERGAQQGVAHRRSETGLGGGAAPHVGDPFFADILATQGAASELGRGIAKNNARIQRVEAGIQGSCTRAALCYGIAAVCLAGLLIGASVATLGAAAFAVAVTAMLVAFFLGNTSVFFAVDGMFTKTELSKEGKQLESQLDEADKKAAAAVQARITHQAGPLVRPATTDSV